MFDIFGEKASDKFPWLAYDDETSIFLLDGNYLGVAFTAMPLTAFQSTMEQRFQSLLTHEFPVGTFLQFNLMVFDDVQDHLEDLSEARNRTRDPLIRRATQNTLRFLNAGAQGHGVDIPIRNAHLMLSIKVPIKEAYPSEEEMLDMGRSRREFLEILTTIGFLGLKPVTDVEMLHHLSIVLNRGSEATWRQGKWAPDEQRFLRDEVLDFNSTVNVENDHLKIGDAIVTSLSVKKYPQYSHFGLARSFSIDPTSGARGILCAHMITGTIYYQDINDQRPKIDRRRQTNGYYADGPFGKLVPEYVKRHRDLTMMSEAISNGNMVHLFHLGVTLFNPNFEAAERQTAKARTYLAELGLTFLPDKYINFPLLRFNLPMGATKTDVRDLARFRTMHTDGIATFIPCFFEWRGTRTPLISLIGRGGQLMGFSPFDSDTNYNVTISAESGSGKSFFANELIAALLGTAGKVWVIDVGRSYLKLCQSLGGQFISFEGDSDVCLNPFSTLTTKAEFDEVQDILTHLLAVMAAPTEGLSDFQTAALRTVLVEQFHIHGINLTIDHIADACIGRSKDQEDGGFKEKRLSDIAFGLENFRKDGQYGKYFDGPSNIDFTANFVLLELEELKSQKHLQSVVLLLLIYQIQNGMYLGQRDVKKAMVIDEAWDLLSEPQIAKFIEAGYRRFRKYNGSAVTITQSLLDLHGTPTGQAILANSAVTVMLKQRESTLTKLSHGDNAEFSPALAEMLKTVHTAPGRYSECYVQTSFGAGIGRFIVDPFRALLYSTNPNDVAAIENYVSQGLTYEKAILAVMEQRGKSEMV